LTTPRVLRIGTRGSQLALWQAHQVSGLLRTSGVHTEIVVLKTTGDRSQQGPVDSSPVESDRHKRQFVKELEEALLAHVVDVAVHSAKDLPVDLPQGLALSACLPREDPLDGFVLPHGDSPVELSDVLRRLKAAARIGTGSVRRIAQLVPLLNGATFVPVRGNVDTRLRKLDTGDFDALVLACAGLRRLGFGGRISAAIPLAQCVPAPGQGIVATEIRSDDEGVRLMVEPIHDEAAGRSLAAERALVAALGGGCQLPLGALAMHDADDLAMHAAVASLDGARVVRRSMRGRASAPAELGRRLADDLAVAGARDILDAIERH
jgi:hydroxymethylbilane synthase